MLYIRLYVQTLYESDKKILCCRSTVQTIKYSSFNCPALSENSTVVYYNSSMFDYAHLNRLSVVGQINDKNCESSKKGVRTFPLDIPPNVSTPDITTGL